MTPTLLFAAKSKFSLDDLINQQAEVLPARNELWCLTIHSCQKFNICQRRDDDRHCFIEPRHCIRREPCEDDDDDCFRVCPPEPCEIRHPLEFGGGCNFEGANRFFSFGRR